MLEPQPQDTPSIRSPNRKATTMTETTTESTAPAETEAVAWTPPDDLAAAFLNKLTEQVNEYNANKRRLDAQSDDNFEPLINDAIKDSQEPEVVSLREKYDALMSKAEDLHTQMREKVRALVTQDKMSDEQIAALSAKIDADRKALVAGLNYADGTYPGIKDAVPALIGSRKTSAGSGSSATGGRKPRVSTIWVAPVVNGAVGEYEAATRTFTDPKTNESKTVSTFTEAAKRIGGGVKVPTLQDAYFDAAKTTDVSEAPDVVDFIVTVGDKHFSLKVEK